MAKRKSKKLASRKAKSRSSAKKAAPRKAKRSYDIHTGKPTGREVQAMHRLQVLTERYIAEGLTPADARTRVREELRANSTAGLASRLDGRAGSRLLALKSLGFLASYGRDPGLEPGLLVTGGPRPRAAGVFLDAGG